MLGRHVGAPVGRREQAAHRRGEDDLALLALPHPLLDDALGQHERQEDVDLVVLAHELDRDLPDRSGFAHAGIVPEHVDVPRLRLGDVVGVGEVEPLDPQGLQAELLRFLAQRRDLRGDLRGGDHGVAVPGHADGRGLAEAGTCAGDENGLGHGLYLSGVEMTLGNRRDGRDQRVRFSKDARAAWATSTSCATVPPETPRAPMTVPSRDLMGMPPPNGARPPLVSSRPGAVRPACSIPRPLRVGLEQHGRPGLADGDVDRGQHRAVHAAEGFQVGAGIEDGDDHRQPQLESLGRRAIDDGLRLVGGDLHDVAPVRVLLTGTRSPRRRCSASSAL